MLVYQRVHIRDSRLMIISGDWAKAEFWASFWGFALAHDSPRALARSSVPWCRPRPCQWRLPRCRSPVGVGKRWDLWVKNHGFPRKNGGSPILILDFQIQKQLGIQIAKSWNIGTNWESWGKSSGLGGTSTSNLRPGPLGSEFPQAEPPSKRQKLNWAAASFRQQTCECQNKAAYPQWWRYDGCRTTNQQNIFWSMPRHPL